MSIWYRASQLSSVETVFSGDGGLYVAGRWNYKGRKVIYCSQSISLCTLEWLSHNGLSVSGFSYYRFSIEIPSDSILTLSIKDLPKEWDNAPSTDKTRDFSEKHLFTKDHYIAMAIPSVLVPEEFNLVINPSHTSFEYVKKDILEMGKYIAPTR